MKRIFTLLFVLLMLGMEGISQRYYQEITGGVEVESDIVYGSNYSVLRAPDITVDDLLCDIYTPAGDMATDRPVVLIAHTGSFLPPLFNQQVTGARSDSIVVNLAKRFAKLGYVAVPFTYRLGWDPTNPNKDLRNGSLLQAAYRAIQDTRTCVRYMRRSAAEFGNPYGIDPAKIAVVGVGTGGYLAMGAGTLDDYEEVTLDKFLDANLNPLADTAKLGDFYATSMNPLCVPNHVGFSSDIQLSVNLGGALGDISWFDGDEDCKFVGFHSVNDIFAPYYEGDVTVPNTGETVIPNAAGARYLVDSANKVGVNAAFNDIIPAKDFLSAELAKQKQTPTVVLPERRPLILGTDNFFGFNLPIPQGSPWDWWDYNTLTVVVALTNQAIGVELFNADTLHQTGLLTNPGMSQAQGLAYLDTIMMVTIPRACVALNLACGVTSVEKLNPNDVSLQIYPNPAAYQTQVTVSENHSIRSVYLYDLEGRLVQAHVDINSPQFTLQKNQLPGGIYAVHVQLDEGVVTQKVMFK